MDSVIFYLSFIEYLFVSIFSLSIFNPALTLNLNPNSTKAQKRFRENKMTSFLGKKSAQIS